MRKVSQYFALCIMIALLVLPVSGPLAQGTTAVVRGTFLSYDGLPIGGITIAFVGDDGEIKAQAITDKEGKYAIENLPVAFGARFTISYRVGEQEFYAERDYNPSTADVNVRETNLQQIARQQGANITPEQAAKFRKNVEESGQRDAMEKHFKSGLKHMEAEDYAMAVSEFEMAGTLDDTQPAIFGNLARAYTMIDEKEKAVGAYQKAIALDPSQGPVHNGLGNLFLDLKRVDEAAASFRKAAEVDPENAGMFLFNLGVAYYNNNRLAEAIEPFRMVTELEPGNARAFYFLGVCLFNQAEWKMVGTEAILTPKPGTVEAFEKYLELDPKGQWADEARQTIQTIEATRAK